MGLSSASNVLTTCCANRQVLAHSPPQRRTSVKRTTSALSRLPGPRHSHPGVSNSHSFLAGAGCCDRIKLFDNFRAQLELGGRNVLAEMRKTGCARNQQNI